MLQLRFLVDSQVGREACSAVDRCSDRGLKIKPLAFGLGVLFLMLTTMAMRYLLPRLKRWGRAAMRPIDLPSLDGARAAASHLSTEFQEAQRRLTLRVRTRWQNG